MNTSQPASNEQRVTSGSMKMLFNVAHPNFSRPLQIFYQPMPNGIYVANRAICKIYEQSGGISAHKIACFDCALGLSFDQIRAEVLAHLAKRAAK